MLHSPVNRLGLGLVTLTGINALIFFLLHIITHAWGGEIERSLMALGRYGSSQLFNAHRQGLPASQLPWVDGREGSVPRTEDPHGPWEGGGGSEEGGGGMLGSSILSGVLCCGFAILFASWGGRIRHRTATDGAPVTSPAASRVGFWCWARCLEARGILHHLPLPGAAGSRWPWGQDKPWTTNPHLNGPGRAGMKLDGCPLHRCRGAGVHLQHPSISSSGLEIPALRGQRSSGSQAGAGSSSARSC